MNHGEHWCISFGGLRTDEAVANEVLHAISGNAVEAALEAAEQMRRQRQEQRKALELEAEQTRHQAHLASRRYEAVDPDNRLVAAELEARWNAELRKAHELEAKLQEFDVAIESAPMPDKEVLLRLARDLPTVWKAPSTDMRLKQRMFESSSVRSLRMWTRRRAKSCYCCTGLAAGTPNYGSKRMGLADIGVARVWRRSR